MQMNRQMKSCKERSGRVCSMGVSVPMEMEAPPSWHVNISPTLQALHTLTI